MNLNLRSTSSVLSSIPVLLGFIPTNSIVVIHLQRPESVALRDVLMAASAETPSGATVWTHVARQLRGSARVEALCVAAACHYAGGDAVRAGIAIDAVHDTARREGLDTTELTRLLDSTVQAGVDPHLVRQMLAKISSAPRD